MENNYIPQRGVDFDDFIGTSYFKKSLKMSSPQLTPVFCPKNGKHDDDFIGINLSGYADSDRGLIQTSRIIYPAKNFTAEDLERLFDKNEAKDGTVAYRAKANVSLDEVFIRVCYKTPGKPNPEEDNIKWVVAVDHGESFALHGERRVYAPKEKDAEA